MEVLLFNLLLSIGTVRPAELPKIGQQVNVVSGHYERCSGRVAYVNGHEYGIYLTCGSMQRYDHIHKRHLEAR